MVDISDNLKKIRKDHGYTMQKLVDKCGIAFRTYQNYESGFREISVEVLCKLADFYGVSTDELLGRKKPELTPLEQLEKQFSMTPLEKRIMENYIKLNEQDRKKAMDWIKNAVKENEESNGGE